MNPTGTMWTESSQAPGNTPHITEEVQHPQNFEVSGRLWGLRGL